MLILIHITAALLSLLQATYGLFVPSRGKLQATYALVAVTFATGTYLVWHLHAPLLQSCLSGLAYLTLILAATVVTWHRLHRVSGS